MRTGFIEVVEPASIATVDGTLPRAALRTRRGYVCVLHGAHQATDAARHVVRIRAAARAIGAAITELVGVQGTMNQQPERDRMRPLIRP